MTSYKVTVIRPLCFHCHYKTDVACIGKHKCKTPTSKTVVFSTFQVQQYASKHKREEQRRKHQNQIIEGNIVNLYDFVCPWLPIT